MLHKILGILKLFTVLFFLTFFTSCSYKNPITRVTDFHSMISDMVDKSSIKKNIRLGEVILVSDFVNLDNLKNKSQLGFLLSNILKDKLSSLSIIVKEIELGREFEFGLSGFNLLTREYDKMLSNKVQSRYAVVGTYSISNKSLNVFIKLIDIHTGNILSSAFARTDVDDEVINLEGNYSIENKNRPVEPLVTQPLVL